MKKTISINISGFAFVIEEEAYSRLKKYLNTIRSYFTTADGVEEIMTDIEIRIAEIFRERLEKREVVDESDVEHVIGILGQPEAFIGEEEHDGSEHAGPTYRERSKRRRIFRDPDHKTLGGVAAGIAAYFGVDTVWIRLLFVLLTIGGFAGIPIYIILWIIMPEARTAAEKLEMRGEPVTVENIGRKVSESFDSVKKNVSELTDSERAAGAGRKAGNWIEEFFIFIGRILLLLLKFIVYLVGIVLIIIGVSLLIGFSMLLFGIENTNLIVLGGQNYGLEELRVLSDLVLLPIGSWWLVLLTFLIVLGIPVLALLYGGIRILFGLKGRVKGLALSLSVLWTLGLIAAIFVTAYTSKDFSSKQEFSETIRLNEFTGDTLMLSVLEDPHFSKHIKNGYDVNFLEVIKLEDEKVIVGNPRVDVVQNLRDTIFEIEIVRSAQGVNRIEAIERAEHIEYSTDISGNNIGVEPFYSFPKSDRLRNQRITVKVHVPLGKSVHFSDDLDRVIYDVKNTTNTFDGNMVGKTWTMLNEGLTCIKCDQDALKRKRPKIQ